MGAFKMLPITTKDNNNSCYCTLHNTFNHRTQMNTTAQKNFFKILQLNANGIHNKTDQVQLVVIVIWKGIHSRSDTNRTGAEGLSFYYPRLNASSDVVNPASEISRSMGCATLFCSIQL